MTIQIKDLTVVREIDMSAVRGGGRVGQLVLSDDASSGSSNDAPAAPVTMAQLWNQMFGGIAPV
jgi:hypothetical protein